MGNSPGRVNLLLVNLIMLEVFCAPTFCLPTTGQTCNTNYLPWSNLPQLSSQKSKYLYILNQHFLSKKVSELSEIFITQNSAHRKLMTLSKKENPCYRIMQNTGSWFVWIFKSQSTYQYTHPSIHIWFCVRFITCCNAVSGYHTNKLLNVR
jgi:hypothetical protein